VETIPEIDGVSVRLLSNCLYLSWLDSLEAEPKAKRFADRVLRAVRRHREGAITLERAVARVFKAQKGFEEWLEDTKSS
jgi:hypothetical protein